MYEINWRIAIYLQISRIKIAGGRKLIGRLHSYHGKMSEFVSSRPMKCSTKSRNEVTKVSEHFVRVHRTDCIRDFMEIRWQVPLARGHDT